MYSLIRPLLFRLDPERAHDIVLAVLGSLSASDMAMRAMRARGTVASGRTGHFMGLTAPGDVGLAAGLDKDARAFPALRALGFGWIEVGTVTPRPQPGNDRPRLFRLERDRALINRMGFNSRGVDRFIEALAARRHRYDSVLGINIGKNADTPMDRAEDDYLYALERVHPYADYVTVNISSPNTQSLRELQHVDRLASFVDVLLGRRDALQQANGRRVPIAFKLSPDIREEELPAICRVLRERSVDGVIATNTTTSRPANLHGAARAEAGGLSGRPLETLATRVVAALYQHLGGEVPIIGAGGVEDAATAERKRAAGACAVQCYTAFIYQGPRLFHRLKPTAAGGPPTDAAGRPAAPNPTQEP
jgi:dihydroorotate dehydrogenase